MKDKVITTGEKERLQALDNMPDGTMYCTVRDMETGVLRFDYVSSTWEKMSGVTVEDTLADIRNVFKHIVPEDLKLLIQQIDESLDPLSNFNFEFRYHYPITKKEHWFQISSYPRRVDEHVVAYGFLFDITARKETELKLLAEKERLETLGNNIPDGVLYQFILDTQTGQMRMPFVSGRWETLTGIPANVVVSSIETLFAMIHPDDLPSMMQNVDNSALTMNNLYTEFRLTVQGATRWMQMSSRPQRQDAVVIWDGIILDITQRKETERELETGKKHLQVLGDNIPGSTLFQFGRDMRTGQMNMLYVSATWETVTGIAAEATLADVSNIFDAIDSDALSALIQTIDKSARTMTDLVFETRFRERWMNIIARPRSEGMNIVWDGILTNISDRKETERELESEKKRLQMLGDNLPNCSLFQFVRDSRTRQMRLSYISATWEAVTGIAADIALTDITQFFSLIPPDTFPSFLKAIDESARAMNDFIMEIRLGDRWMHMVSRPRNESTLIVWDGIMTDITERKNDEAELAKYRENLELLVQERTEELETTNEELFAANEELYATNEELHNKNTQIADEMNARMEVMKLLEDSENKMRNFIEQSHEGIVILDNDGRIIEWNPGQERITGIPRKEALGEYGWTLYQKIAPEENAEKLVDEFHNVILSYIEPSEKGRKKPDTWELAVKHGDNERHLIVTSFQILLADKLFMGQIVRDVTQQKLNEKELEQYHTQLEQMVEQRTVELIHAKEKAEESDKLKSAFLANMSHEIRTPLNGIIGFLQFIDSDDLTPARRKEYIKVITDSSKQLTKIIDDVIDISKIEAQQMNICPVPVELNTLMHELTMIFESYLKTGNKTHIELILDDSGFIDRSLIYVDTIRLRQVFDNLMSNAIKFTEKGYIRIGYRQPAPDLLEFVVEDSGIGLSPNQQEVIFERFRQAELGHNRLYGGTGLGLTIARSLVQMMGGNIWVESTESIGSSFYFTIAYLPITPEDKTVFDEPSSDEPTDVVLPFTDKTIVIGEPAPLRFNYYERLIAATGATASRVETLQECCQFVANNSFINAVLVNASLFDNQDTDTICCFKNERPNLPVALIVPEKNEKYTHLLQQRMCTSIIEAPVTYAKIHEFLKKNTA